MRDLDDKDLDIIQLLLTDGRRPYSDIAERVELSPPAVSDRVDRLKEMGVIRRFTVDLDRNVLGRGNSFILTLDPRSGATQSVYDAVRGEDAVETANRLADGSIIVHVHLPSPDATGWLEEVADLDAVRGVEVATVVETDDQPGLQVDRFDLECVVCGNPVDDSGELARFDGVVKPFCCESCLARYADRYEHHEQQAG